MVSSNARKPKTKEKKPSVDSSALLDVYADALDEAKMDTVGTIGSSVATHLISTGVAALDNLIGGGIPYGTWMCIAGGEASAKSLLASTIAGSFCRQNVAKVIYTDAEASQEATWMRTAMRDPQGKSYFGEVDSKGRTTVRPRIDYSTIDVIEDAFGLVSQTFKNFPDKIYDDVDDQWYLVVPQADKKTERFRQVLGEPDKKKSKKAKLWFPIDDPAPQIAWIADSWPMFNPSAEDEEGEATNALAAKARCYSKNLPLVRGKIKRKAAIVIGVNQLRKNPGVMYGPTETEPCGEALKYASSLRIHTKALSVPKEWQNLPKNSKSMDEESVEGEGRDDFMFKRVDLVKSKLKKNGGKTWIRVWTSDHLGRGRGVDPVYDAAQFLTDAGIAIWGNTRKFGHHCVEFPEDSLHPLKGKTLRWEQVKILVLSEVFPSKRLDTLSKSLWEELEVEPFQFYQWCFDNMPKSGESIDEEEEEDYPSSDDNEAGNSASADDALVNINTEAND